MSVNVTVLTDGNGVQREYREVNRKAIVGELVKIVSCRMLHGLPIGSITVLDKDGVADGWFLEASGDSDRDYVVLEPTSTVIINGVRYTEEKRKARVGERILIVNSSDSRWKNGEVFTVAHTTTNGVLVPHEKGRNATYPNHAQVFADDYVVLTPIYTLKAESLAAPTVINLAITVNVQPGADVAQAVADAVKAELHKITPALRKSTEKTPQQIRDEIVERAKADVAELERVMLGAQRPHLSGSFKEDEGNFTFRERETTVKFHVNREKRAVTALVYEKQNGKLREKGIAKCAPSDVFNSHIGRAIALRRALGLEVPAEYLNAPQPTEVRVGDVVQVTYGYASGVTGAFVSYFEDGALIDSVRKNPGRTDGYWWAFKDRVKVIDDSREETEVSA